MSSPGLRPSPILNRTMAVLVNKAAPDFTATAVMEDGSTKQVSLSDYKGQNVVLFFYPKDFTFV